jgi:hypothetical protein
VELLAGLHAFCPCLDEFRGAHKLRLLMSVVPRSLERDHVVGRIEQIRTFFGACTVLRVRAA